jgi:hypothetical protein
MDIDLVEAAMRDRSLAPIDLIADGLSAFLNGRRRYRPRLPPDQKQKRVVIGINLPEKMAKRRRDEGARRGIGAASMLQPLVPLLIAALDREALARAKAADIADAVEAMTTTREPALRQAQDTEDSRSAA